MSACTCRFCHAEMRIERAIKYGARHYAHSQCLLEAKGADFIAALPSAQILKMEVRLLGVDATVAMHKAAVDRELRRNP